MRIQINIFGHHLTIQTGRDTNPEPAEPEALSTHGGDFGFGIDLPTMTEAETRWH